jgi:hypothetical protein
MDLLGYEEHLYFEINLMPMESQEGIASDFSKN